VSKTAYKRLPLAPTLLWEQPKRPVKAHKQDLAPQMMPTTLMLGPLEAARLGATTPLGKVLEATRLVTALGLEQQG